METLYEKLDGVTLKVTTPIESTKETTYDIEFLKNQEISILKSKNDFCEARDKELLEIRALIAKCNELGIKPTAEVELEAEVIKESTLLTK